MAHVQCAKIIKCSKFKAYDYLTSPINLSEQLEGHIEVKLQNPGIEVAPASEFLFLMTRFGIEQPIRFVIDRMVVGNSLTYKQVSGVYARFVHTMKFEEHGKNETLVTDFLEYEIPFGLFGRLADDFFIRSDLTKLLEARFEVAKVKLEAESKAEADAEATAAEDTVVVKFNKKSGTAAV